MDLEICQAGCPGLLDGIHRGKSYVSKSERQGIFCEKGQIRKFVSLHKTETALISLITDRVNPF